MVDQLQTSGGVCFTKDGVIPSGTDTTCCCGEPVPADCHTMTNYKARNCFSDLLADYPADDAPTNAALAAYLAGFDIDVTLAGFSDDPSTECSAGSCASLNGTWTCTYLNQLQWRYQAIPWCESNGQLDILARFLCNAGTCFAQVSVTISNPSDAGTANVLFEQQFTIQDVFSTYSITVPYLSGTIDNNTCVHDSTSSASMAVA